MHTKIVEDFGDLDWGEPQGWDNRLRSKTEPHAAEAGWPPRAALVVLLATRAAKQKYIFQSDQRFILFL